MEAMYKQVVSLDTLFSEYEEILSRVSVVEFRAKAATLLGNEQEEYELAQEKVRLEKIEALVMQEILIAANAGSLSEARKVLFKMKAVLNEYSSRVGEEYAEEELSPLSVQELSRISFESQKGVIST